MRKFEDRVAIITGGARGQGRSHAVALAREGCDVVLVDALEDNPTVPFPMANEADMAETVRLVETTGCKALVEVADVRSYDAMVSVVGRTVEQFGRLDIMLANAGSASYHPWTEMTEVAWRGLIELNLNGVFNAVHSATRPMVEQRSGRIIATASLLGKTAQPNMAHYSAAKWGVIGLVKNAALELAQHNITVNAVCPCSVNTDMIKNQALYDVFCPDLEHPTLEDALPVLTSINPMGTPWIEPADVSAAIVFLCSDEARFITGIAMDVGAGGSAQLSS
jgi:SDR family mycofactocin-dependent oxidoreductase